MRVQLCSVMCLYPLDAYRITLLNLPCRHGIMFRCSSLQGPERHGYYVLELEQVFRAFSPANGRRIAAVYLDNGCRFRPSLGRWVLEPLHVGLR